VLVIEDNLCNNYCNIIALEGEENSQEGTHRQIKMRGNKKKPLTLSSPAKKS
jgi:hypothetical protein